MHPLRPRALAWLVGVALAVLAIAAPQDAADPRLLQRIERQILNAPGLSAFDWVGFSLAGRQVTLLGWVADPDLRKSLAKRVRNIEGVESIENALEALPRTSRDRGLRALAFQRIYGHTQLRKYSPTINPNEFVLRGPSAPSGLSSAGGLQQVVLFPIHILVNQGHVTLEGQVDSRSDRELAVALARNLPGVESATNHLLIFDSKKPLAGGNGETPSAQSQGVGSIDVRNRYGNVTIHVIDELAYRVRKAGLTRKLQPNDVSVERNHDALIVETQPSDGAAIDLDIDVPYFAKVRVATDRGSIQLHGFVRAGNFETRSGAVELAVPWKATRLEATAGAEPRELVLPEEIEFSEKQSGGKGASHGWVLRAGSSPSRVAFSGIRVQAETLQRLVLRESPIPANWPVKMHWQAPRILDDLFGDAARLALPDHPVAHGDAESSELRFTSDVRLVNLTLSVGEKDGRPVAGLRPQDFEVLEDGARQEVDSVGAEEIPFNLVLLLDCSGSTHQDRPAIAEAARRFIGVARPHDRVAVYTLADTHFHVLSPLTSDREQLLERLNWIDTLEGGSPLYDIIVLSYAQELAQHQGERNALIVISDGVDNQLQQNVIAVGAPSEVPYSRLRRVVQQMDTLVYPIFLDPVAAMTAQMPALRSRAREWGQFAAAGLAGLADSSGGRMFRANSLHDLDPVYPLVAQELRSAYTVTYYPKNQDFDGSWRKIRVKVKRPGVRVRTRSGYFAR